MKTPTLNINRLILKRCTLKDFIKVYEYDFTKLRNINGEFEYVLQNPENIKGYETYADTEAYVLDFIIYLKNETPIGNILLDKYDENNNSLEVSINIHPNYWRNGYTTEALHEIFNYAFSKLSIDNIIYEYAEENFKSKYLSQKLGFKYISSSIVHYTRINKDINEIKTIFNKEYYLNKKTSDC